jgi:hypothetical protein
MSTKKTSHRVVRLNLCLGALLAVAVAQGQAPAVQADVQELMAAEAQIMDRLVQTYGNTDWSRVVAWMNANPGDDANPNIMMIPLSLSNAYLNRFELGNDTADLERSIRWAEWVASNHDLWRDRWLTGAVAGYLALTGFRLRQWAWMEGYGDRLASLDEMALSVLAEEATSRLDAELPARNHPRHLGDPYDSSMTGDSKGEENAWEAGLLATAATLAPDHPRAAAWERKARQLAYNSLTRASDPPDAEGLKTTTIDENYLLSNHNYFPNPYYTVATVLLLTQGALMYRMTGREVPTEFEHNVSAVYSAYRGLLDNRLEWTLPSDPKGDAALFPLALDPMLESKAVAKRLEDGILWKPTSPVAVMTMGDPLWDAIMNSKVVYFYLVGSYLWHGLQPQLDVPVCVGNPS